MARKRKKISQPKKDVFAIIADGETEVWYFQMLKRNEPYLQINVEPKIPQKKRLSEQYKEVIELAEDYTKIFWIIDLDDIIKKSNETKKRDKTKIQELKEYLKELEKEKFKNVITILNNPCLEYWFLLHFEKTAKHFPKCSSSVKQLKKYLKDYTKNQKYFTKQNNDIYLKLKPKLSTAIKNSKSVHRKNLNDLDRAICEMSLFFETKEIILKNII